jgi:DNA processing protein
VDEKQYWVGFNLVKGIGARRMQSLLAYFGDAASAWKAPAEMLQAAGLSARLVHTVLQVRESGVLEQTWARIEALNIQVLTWNDPSYPQRLTELDQSPPVLYMRGELCAEDEWTVAIVGTRRPTAYGKQVAEEVAGSLARQGITVVSGLARGIDAIAHHAAMTSGGRTLAVLGSGVDQIYPPEHRALAEKIMAHGAIISDYAPGTPPEAANFPPRNRIISGLSRAVVVVEAGLESGALITAAFAADQGREVFAVPGSIYAVQSKGTNILIQQGARPLLSAQDILQTLNLGMAPQQQAARTALPADAVEAELYSILSQEPMHVDEIRAKTHIPIEKVSAALVMMELKGMVRQVGGMQYVSIRESQADYQID